MENNFNEEVNLIEIIQFVLRNKNIIIGCFVISLVIGIFFALIQKKNYVAEAGILILVKKQEISFEPKIQDKEYEINLIEERKKTLVEIVKSPIVAAEVLSKAEQKGIVKKNEIKLQDLIREKSKIIDVKTSGSVVKVMVSLPDKYQAKFFADEIVKTSVEKIFSLLLITQKENVDEELKNVRQKYNEAVAKYNQFINNNKILELTAKIDRLTQIYNYYKDKITEIEKYLWQAKSLREQIEHGGATSVGEFANMLALLKFKSSIFAGSSELPLKFEITHTPTQKVGDASVDEINSIISILEKRKKEFEEELKTENYEQQIRQLQAELEKEKIKQKELLKNKDLLWETLVSLERKKEELNVKNGIKEEIAKVAYLSVLPEYPDSGKRKIIVFISCCIGLCVGILFSFLKEMYYKAISSS